MHSLKGKKVLVTGGAGNIGSYIIDALKAEDPEQIVCVDNMFNGRMDHVAQHIDQSYFKFYNVDVADYSSLAYVFRTHLPDHIFHQASMLIQDSETLPHKAIQTNIVGTFNIVQLGNEFEIKKMCYASSASIFGQPKYLPVDEDHPVAYKQNYLYGATKIANEAIVGTHARFDWVGLRYYNVFSERQSTSAFYTQVINYLYNNISNGKPVEIHNDGSQTVDLIHAADIAEANIASMKSGISGELFNVGTGVQTSVLDLAGNLMKVMGTNVEIKSIPHHDSDRHVTLRQSSTKKIREMLGFNSRIGLEEGLKRFVEYRQSREKA